MNDKMNTAPQIGKDVIESLTIGMYEDCTADIKIALRPHKERNGPAQLLAARGHERNM